MLADDAGRRPLSTMNNESQSSVRFAEDVIKKTSKLQIGGGSSSLMSSGSAMPSAVVSEMLIMRGTKKRPVAGQTIDTFFNSLTHLRLNGLKLTGDVAAITPCKQLRVLYVYDNRLTSLGGLGGLVRLTHLYAQDNRIESLDDFEAPPALQQLHIANNRLSVIGGLEGCTCLEELHIGGQRPVERLEVVSPTSSASGESDKDGSSSSPASGKPGGDVADDGEAGSDSGTSAPSPAPSAASSGPPPLSIEPASLLAISQTLRKLVASGGRIDDDALEPFVMLQALVSLDVHANRLESIGRLQQVLLRLPGLASLRIRDNPLMLAPKLRERVIVAAQRLADLDGKPIQSNERAFLEQLAHRQSVSAQGARGGGGEGGAEGGSGIGRDPRARTSSANRGRPQQLGVSIPSAQSYDLGRSAGLLMGEPPAGFYDDEHRPVSLTLQKGTSRPWGRAPHAA
jgi:hypothetical protein